MHTIYVKPHLFTVHLHACTLAHKTDAPFSLRHSAASLLVPRSSQSVHTRISSPLHSAFISPLPPIYPALSQTHPGVSQHYDSYSAHLTITLLSPHIFSSIHSHSCHCNRRDTIIHRDVPFCCIHHSPIVHSLSPPFAIYTRWSQIQ